MNKIVFAMSTLLCCWSTSSVFAHSNGEITFQGAIIEAPNCQATQVNTQIQLDCSTNNNNTLSENDIVFDSQLEYLDPDKKLAVMQITYH